jgi:hypothetical protein
MIKSDRRLYLTEGGTDVVEEGDPRAAFLLVGKGCEIEEAEVAKWGLVFPLPEAQADATPEPGPLEVEPTKPKRVRPPASDTRPPSPE